MKNKKEDKIFYGNLSHQNKQEIPINVMLTTTCNITTSKRKQL